MTDPVETLDPRAAAIKKKQKETSDYVGVTFDARINKFTAAITISGKRKYLGAFDTAHEAGGVYEIARSENPVVRKRGADGEALSFAAFYRDFLDDIAETSGKKHGWVSPGDVFIAPDGQSFCMDKIDIRQPKKGKRWIFYVWSSECRFCGAPYKTKTVAGQINTGMTRNCSAHKGERGPGVVRQETAPEVRDFGPIVAGETLPGERPYNAYERAGLQLGYEIREIRALWVKKVLAEPEPEDESLV